MGKESTKDKILQAAIQLLETSGIKGFTQPAVAKLVGIPQGQLTYHYRHRADLVLAVTEKAMDRVAEYLWKNHPELASKSFSKMISLVTELMKSKTRVRAMVGLMIEADEHPEVREKLMEQAEKVRKLIATAYQVDEDSAEVTVSHALMTGFSMFFFLRKNKEEEKILEEHFNVAAQMLEKHIKEKRTKAKGRRK